MPQSVIGAHHGALQGGVWAPPAGQLAWWYGSDTTSGKWTDRTGNGRHQTLYADAAVASGYLALDGTGDYASTAAFSFGSSGLTIALWAYPTSGSAQMGLVTKNGAYGQETVHLYLLNRQIVFRLYKTTAVYIGRATPDNVTDVNAWQHIVATWDGSLSSTGIKIYKNLNNVDSSDNNAGTFDTFPDSSYPINLGSMRSTASLVLPGRLDDVMIYPSALTSGNLSDIYANSPGTHAP